MPEPRYFQSSASLKELLESPYLTEEDKDGIRVELADREQPSIQLVIDHFYNIGLMPEGNESEIGELKKYDAIVGFLQHWDRKGETR